MSEIHLSIYNGLFCRFKNEIVGKQYLLSLFAHHLPIVLAVAAQRARLGGDADVMGVLREAIQGIEYRRGR